MIKDVQRKPYINILYLLVIILVLFSNIFANYLSIFLYLKPNISETNCTQIHYISAGQGDCIAISFASGETMLIDSGTELYRNKITRYLDNIVLKGNRIDYVVLTHTDLDHSSNIEYILNRYDVGTFYRPPVYTKDENPYNYVYSETYEKILDTAKRKGVTIKFNDDDNVLKCGSATISWLYPDMGDLYGYTDSTNIYSAVMILEDNGIRAMFTGDISSRIERDLIDNYSENDLDIDILKIPHHGSNTSTSSDFLEATTPDYAIISVGDNSYGHPSEGVLSRILEYDEVNGKNLQNNTYRTDRDGNIILTLDKEVIVEFVDNIDKYSFSQYWLYSLIFAFLIVFFMLKPYMEMWYKRWRFDLHNKKHKEKQLESSGK